MEENKELEIWEIINDFPDYQISSLGRVISNKYGKIKYLVLNKDKDGYLAVHLRKNKKGFIKKVHRLVGFQFVSNPLLLPEINHKNGIKKDNYYLNLEWSTRMENCTHALRTGLKPYATEKQVAAVRRTNLLKNKSVSQYTLTNELIRCYESITCAAKENQLDIGNIGKCCRGVYSHCGGFKWAYLKTKL